MSTIIVASVILDPILLAMGACDLAVHVENDRVVRFLLSLGRVVGDNMADCETVAR